MGSSIFFQFSLPNSVSWYYFSFILTIALFFQFTRVFTVRNLDLLGLFLFAPGFLLLQESNQCVAADEFAAARRLRYVGYGWLLGASLYWFVRAQLDLMTFRRPLVAPNLSVPGLVWLSGVLLVILVGVAYSRSSDPWEPVGKLPAAVTGVQESATTIVTQASVSQGHDPTDVKFYVERTLAVACHAAVVLGLFFVGWKVFCDLPTGVAGAMLYLLLPYTAYHIGQIHHVWPAALLLWAVFWYRRPTVAGVLLGLAAGTAFFPLLLLPVWMHFYRPQGTTRFLAGFGLTWLLGLAGTLVVLSSAGHFPDGMWQTLHLADWYPWKTPTAESVWTGAHWAYRIPVFVVYVAYVVTLVAWPPVRNLGQLIASSAGVLIGIQFWFADRGGVYVLWYLPLLVLMVLRPNLAELKPVNPGPLPTLVRRLLRQADAVEHKSPVA